MSKNLTVTAQFHGTTLEGVVVRGKAYVAMKPIVEALGMDWTRQLQKLKADPVLGPEVCNIRYMPSAGGAQTMACLPEELLQGWLFKISPAKVKPGTRERLITYQREAYRVLHEAFTQSKTEANTRVLAIDSKRAMARVMTDVLQDVLQLDGKAPAPHDFSNEHRLCNWALTGRFGPVAESSLTTEEASMLAEIRRRNSVLIARGLSYEARKPLLQQYAADLRSAGRQLRRAA